MQLFCYGPHWSGWEMFRLASAVNIAVRMGKRLSLVTQATSLVPFSWIPGYLADAAAAPSRIGLCCKVVCRSSAVTAAESATFA